MCAINGIIYFSSVDNATLRNKLQIMLDLTKHRGPDVTEKIILNNAALGVNRLAIVSPEDSTIIQKQGDLFALMNGEIINHKTLKQEYNLKSTINKSDTSIILPLYEKYKEKFVNKIAGMFSIAIFDSNKNKLQLWRDPLGIKPLYYYQTKDFVIFSSEIKAIYKILDIKPDINFQAIDHILKIRFHPGDTTIFPNIKRVLPGETVIFEKEKILKHTYWDVNNFLPNDRIINNHEESKLTHDFREFFEEIVNEYDQADINGGYFVSGGIDSSLVTSIAINNKTTFRTPITLKFDHHKVDDEDYSLLLEKYLKVKFNWVSISSKLARDTLKKLVFYMDEPLENPIHVGTFLMAERAQRLGLKSVMTGDGSDEFFLGYERHNTWFSFKNSKTNPDRWLKWLWTLKPDDASVLYTNDVKDLISPIFNFNKNRLHLTSDFAEAILFEQKDRLPEYHCMRLDRMTMAHGIEARVPFLDHRVVEFVQKLPFAFRYGKSGKDWLRNIAKPYLPKEIIDRPKAHFPSLPDIWLKNEGIIWAKEILLDKNAKTKNIFRKEVVELWLNEHQRGTKLRGKTLWACVALELWLNNSWL